MRKRFDSQGRELNKRGNLKGVCGFKPPRDKHGHILPGAPPGPGRPKGSCSGRTKALLLLDRILSKEKNLEELRRALLRHFHKNPVRFFRQFVIPLVPKEALIKLETPEKAKVRILFGDEIDPSPLEQDEPSENT